MFYVYHHIRKDTNEVFYVGKGKGSRAHSKVSRNKHWHNINNKCGFLIDIIAEGLSEEEAFDLEKQEISRLLESGCELVNLTEGGEGTSGRKYSPETIEKIRLARLGKQHSPEAIEKMRLAKLGKPNLALKGKPKAPEHVEKMAASKRGKPNPCTPEKAAAISKAKKGRPLSESHVEALKTRWQDPERREKHRQAMKEHWNKRKAQGV